MKNCEIRERAWELLWRKNWFWKLLCGAMLLQIASQAVIGVLDGILTRKGVLTFQRLIDNFKVERVLPEFSGDIVFELSISFVLYLFIAFLFTGICGFGNAKLLNRAAADNDADWLKQAFSGFKIPLALVWLTFRISLVFFFWAVVALIPCALTLYCLKKFLVMPGSFASIAIALTAVTSAAACHILILAIPFYRYRYLFRIKADNPESTAGECMRSCRELTAGKKWLIFKHDCSYWRIFLLSLLFGVLIGALLLVLPRVLIGSNGSFSPGAAVALSSFAILIFYLALVVPSVVCVFYNGVGQSILYREISNSK